MFLSRSCCRFFVVTNSSKLVFTKQTTTSTTTSKLLRQAVVANTTTTNTTNHTNHLQSATYSSKSSNNDNDTMNLIINAVGIDRLGIVSDVSRVVIECGGNVGESVAGRLGSHFSLMMLVTIPKSQLSNMKHTILHIPDMDSAVFDTKTDAVGTKVKTPAIGYAGKFVLEGADHPGIVHRVTSALAKNNLNIDNLHTEQELAPYGGAVLFKMRGIVVATAPLAKHFDIHKIKNELSTLGDSLNCEISLEDLVDEKYESSFYAG